MHELEVHQHELEIQNEELRTARVDLESALSRYTELFDYAPIGYATFGHDDTITGLNHEGAALLGSPRASLIGKRFGALVDTRDVETFRTMLAAARLEPAGCEVVLRDRPTVLNLTASQQSASLLLAFRDITERREKTEQLAATERELREAHRRKDEFLAMLAHELRNPLAPIRTSLFVLRQAEPGSPPAREAEDIIDRQVGHLVRLVDDLLDITRITHGKIQLRRERVDLGAIVQRAVDDQRDAFLAKSIAIEVHVIGAPIWIDADLVRIVQALTNVLVNAEKFTPQRGRVDVTVGYKGQYALVRVRDNGIGVAPDVIPHLFVAFAQAPQPIDRGGGGLGLGLATVKGLVELHGGTVAITSDGIGRGTLVEIALPRVAPPPPTLIVPKLPSVLRRRVLVIEDHPEAAQSLEAALRLLGHDPKIAADGKAGLSTARDFRPEVVLCDIGLPGMDGYGIARAFRAEPELRHTFLVALSGYAQAEHVQRALEAGFNRHIAKPADIETLLRVIAEASVDSPRPR